MSMQFDQDDKLIDELGKLVGLTCDGLVTEAERSRLNELLDRDAAARSWYLQYIAVHSLLTTTAGNQAVRGVEELRHRLASQADSAVSQRRRSSILALSRNKGLLAAAMLFLLLTAVLYVVDPWGIHLGTNPESAETPMVDNKTDAPLANSDSHRYRLARVNRVSANARWKDPNESYSVEASLRAGKVISLLQGEVELVYETGVKLVLIGPADFLVREHGGELRRGGLMATVPAAGQGFTIATPTGKVVDLGTQFGVVVDDFGVSEVSVFQGRVEAYPSDDRQGIELTEGRALQWSDAMVRSLDADPRRAVFSLNSASRTGAGTVPTQVSLQNSFQGDSIQSDQWSALGIVRADSDGLVFVGNPDSGAQPYLVSAGEFDPADGEITIVCDLRFPHLQPTDEPSFAILTRSENRRSEMSRPWTNLLASCVRCNFRTASDIIDGLLEMATKYERDRELTGISWQGFRRPQENTSYRLVMRDDGINVSFTVSQVDKPSISKTVTCRSLFQGYQNHIALEGWAGGVVVVDSVKVFQARALDNEIADVNSSAESSGKQEQGTPPSDHTNGLKNTVPMDCELVMADSFDDGDLNQDVWTTLGDVVLENSAVSLGMPAQTDHIDTFHPRPYLLTRQSFSPEQGKLFILGKIEFDENFLQGYGGSFAVMTRCGKQYGEGPEWAISALETGLRCNFWPAAPTRDHNLEIHAKATPSTLSFLTGASLDIEPHSRLYYFCMEDDGNRAAVTIQDASNSSIRSTVQADTSSRMRKSGFIGFESCWGSRVLLDDIQIYRQPQAPSVDEKQ